MPMKNLLRKNKHLLPDFIIAGGMKCGTTSLHHILDRHPDIYIAKEEIHFFNIDDLVQHTDSYVFVDGVWHYPKYEKDFNDNLNWYQSFFLNSKEHQLIGEDSTTYLASGNVPERISELIPNVKIIIMLRDPTLRAYSNYWHLLRTGRALWNFENSLQISPFDLIERSCYKSQIEMFMKFISRDQIYFILFEEYISDSSTVVKDLCKFLGISFDSFDMNKIETHQNRASVPAVPIFQVWANRMLRLKKRKHRFTLKTESSDTSQHPILKLTNMANKIHRLFNPLKEGPPPPMKTATKLFLDDYFQQQSKGLSTLVEKNIDAYWYKT